MPATKDYWPLVLESLRGKISSSHYKTWFSRLQFVSIGQQGRKIILGVPSSFNKNYIDSKFKSELKDSIGKYYPQVIHIDYEVVKNEDVQNYINSETTQQVLVSDDQPAALTSATPAKKETISSGGYLPKRSLNNLNPRYSFDNYVIAKYNELIANIAKGVIESPGSLYNPLFMYSNVGLGKTHLIQALGHKMLENRPGFNIKYIPAETFKQQYINAVQRNEYAKFREFYSEIDLLLMDDIQSMSGNEGTQTVFFHIFNELHQMNKQIIITSDKSPKDLFNIDDRLLSRFEGGMVIDIPKPDFEDRMAIAKFKLEKAGLQLDNSILTKIATDVNTNIRDLEGVINQIQARAKMLPDKTLTLEDVARVIHKNSPEQEEISSGVTSRVHVYTTNPDKIMQAVCRVFCVTKADLIGSKREKAVSTGRQYCMWFFKNTLDLSYPVIGKMLGGRDHSTVIHACVRVSEMIENDPKTKERIQLIKQTLREL